MDEHEINFEKKKITVKEAASIIGTSQEFIRIGLREKQLTFRYSSKDEFKVDLSYFTTIIL